MIGRLIQQQNLRPLCQRSGDMHTLPLATGQGVPGPFLQVQHVHILQGLTHDGVVIRAPRLQCRQPGRAAQFDGVEHSHRVAGFSLLLDHRQQARHVSAAHGGEWLFAQPDRAAARLLNAGQQFEQGGFARAIGADNRKCLAGCDAQLDITQQRGTTHRVAETRATEYG